MDLTIVVGGQAGSEGKGAICAFLHRRKAYDMAVRVGGPNAGHSVVDDQDRKWALRQLPVAVAVDPGCLLVIAAGSEVDFSVLNDEIVATDSAGLLTRNRVFVDSEATVIDNESVLLERSITTGTTGKGIGGARAQRALRASQLVRHQVERLDHGAKVTDTQSLIRSETGSVLLEGTQGYILGSHAGDYPYTTSGDCRAIDFMAAAGIAPQEARTVIVLRMHPIRIAGESGPLRDETTWEEIGVPEEITTVTKKVRRVGRWDWGWAARSIDSNFGAQGVEVALTFVDYVYPNLAGVGGVGVPMADLPLELRRFIDRLEEETQCLVTMLGTGANSVLELSR